MKAGKMAKDAKRLLLDLGMEQDILQILVETCGKSKTKLAYEGLRVSASLTSCFCHADEVSRDNSRFSMCMFVYM